MMFPGLRSRWVTPRAWAAFRASTSGIASLETRPWASPFSGTRSERIRPSMYSMVKKWTPSASSTEKMVTMLGWFRAATIEASLPEAFEPIGIGAQVGRQNFDRDIATELGVVREVDLAHAAGAELAEDRVVEKGFRQQSIRFQSLFENETPAPLFPSSRPRPGSSRTGEPVSARAAIPRGRSGRCSRRGSSSDSPGGARRPL